MTISRQILLRIRNVSDNSCREKHILCAITFFFSENYAVYGTCRNMWWSQRSQMLSQYGANALRAGYAKLQARTNERVYATPRSRAPPHTTHKYVILLFRGKNGFVNATQCYVIRTLPGLFRLYFRKTEEEHHSGRNRISEFSNIIETSKFCLKLLKLCVP
jgi:hypothetical protein